MKIVTPLISVGSLNLSVYNLILSAIALGMLAVTWVLARHTRFGLLIRGTMQNAEIASAMGVSPDRVYMVTFGFGSALAGLAGAVLVRGQRCPVLGNVCMDQAMVDVSDIPAAAAGDIATIIGPSGGAEISVTAFAKAAGSIPNEIVSRLGTRLERAYIVNQLENTAHAAHKVRALPKAVYARYQKLA